MSRKVTDEDRTFALKRLKELLPIGSKLIAIDRGGGRYAPTHYRELYVIKKNELIFVSVYVARVLGLRMRGVSAVINCGQTSPSFEIAHSLSYKLHGSPTDRRWVQRVKVRGRACGYTIDVETI